MFDAFNPRYFAGITTTIRSKPAVCRGSPCKFARMTCSADDLKKTDCSALAVPRGWGETVGL
jgi:hypothetical protein